MDSDSMYRAVLAEAEAIYLDRNEQHGDLWLLSELGVLRALMEHKLLRVKNASVSGKDCRDEALDLINYAAFYVALGFADATGAAKRKKS